MKRPPHIATLIVSLILLVPAARSADPALEGGVYSEPLPRNWPPPVYPPEALKAGVEGRVIVGFVVDAEGRVVDPVIRENKQKPVDPRLNDAVLAAVKSWTFAPALNAGQPEPRAVIVPVGFFLKGRGGQPTVNLPVQPEIAPTRPAKALAAADPAYPDELLPRKLSGAAEFEFQVSAAGRVEDIKVLFASDAGFVMPGLDTLRRWTFEPARQGPLAVVSGKKSPMQFFVSGEQASPEDVLAANGIAGFPAGGAPSPLILFAPVYPREQAEAGETGAAEVEFVIGEHGLTEYVNVMSASRPEFGAALAAAVAMWQFRPVAREGATTPVTLRAHWIFALKETDADARLVTGLKAGIAGARGLDRPLQPLWRVAPRYPAALLAEKPAGETMIEFVIDREGRARLPRVVSASHEAFGWAAATAISQWVFAPPVRGGQPVDTRVSIPVNFAPPKE